MTVALSIVKIYYNNDYGQETQSIHINPSNIQYSEYIISKA